MVTVTLPVTLTLSKHDSELLQTVEYTGLLEESIAQLIDGIIEKIHDKVLTDKISANPKIQSLTSQLSGI